MTELHLEGVWLHKHDAVLVLPATSERCKGGYSRSRAQTTNRSLQGRGIGYSELEWASQRWSCDNF